MGQRASDGNGDESGAVCGAGIGLAVVAEIMQAHGGFVVLDNSASGASLRLLFPMTRQKGAAK